MGVQMFVCMSVGMWRANGNSNPFTDLDEICTHAHPHLSKEGFGTGLTSHPFPLGLGGLKYSKLKNTFLKTVYKTKDVQHHSRPV